MKFVLKSVMTTFLCVAMFTLTSGMNDEFLKQGNDYYRNGEYVKAISQYHEGLRHNENPSLIWFNMGNSWYHLDSISKAIVCYESATLEAPDFFRAWVNLGILYFELEDYGCCIAALDRALRLKSDNVQVLSILATAHKELENYSQAVVYLEKVLEKEATRYEAYLMLYEMAYELGDFKEALSWLSRYPETGSRSYDVILLSGEIKMEIGDTDGALYQFRRCCRLYPLEEQAWYHLIHGLHELGTDQAAVSEAERALSVNGTFSRIALLAGKISFENGYYRKSEKFYEKAYRAGRAEGLIGLRNVRAVYEKSFDYAGLSRINSIVNNVTAENNPKKMEEN